VFIDFTVYNANINLFCIVRYAWSIHTWEILPILTHNLAPRVGNSKVNYSQRLSASPLAFLLPYWGLALIGALELTSPPRVITVFEIVVRDLS